VTIKFLLLTAAGALATGGALMAYLSTRPVVVNEAIVSSEPRHPVTSEMNKFSAERKLKDAPKFERTAAFGEKIKIADPQNEKPQFVMFIKDGCPCSIEVEPLFHDLNKVYGKRIDFVGVIDVAETKAKQWHTDMLMPYPVIADENQEIIQAYGIKNSAFSALVSQDGKIVKMWPGYSKSILKEMNETFAKEVGLKAKPFDPKYAPERATSGCQFTLEKA